MAGWTCLDNDLNTWDGTLKAKKFLGDGSLLTGITGGGHVIQDEGTPQTQRTNLNFSGTGVTVTDNLGTDSTDVDISGGGSLWASNAEHIYPVSVNQIVSGAGFTTAGYVSGANITILTTSGAQTTVDLSSLSSAYYVHIPQYNVTSGGLLALSNAYYNFIPIYQQTSGGLKTVSAAYYTHAGNASDPHGATLTQTRLSITSGAGTGDITVSKAEYIPNVVWGTDTTPPTASNYPRGTIYFQYTP